jgi:hypothetical protein
MMQQQSKTTDKATISEGEPMPELQSLTLRAQELSRSVAWWNTAMIWALVIAAIAAAAIVVATRKTITKTAELDEVKERIAGIKEADSKVQQRTLELAVASQQERAATAEIELVKLRERIKDRHLSGAEQKALTGKLLPFAGQLSMLVTLAGDPEIVGIGNDLIVAIKAAKWNLTTVLGNAPHGEVHNGIVVEVGPDAPKSAIEAANALASAFRSVGLATDGPKPAARILSASGATFSGSPPLDNINLITVTIAKKP